MCQRACSAVGKCVSEGGGGGGERERRGRTWNVVVKTFSREKNIIKQTLNAALKNEPSLPSEAAPTTAAVPPPLRGEGGGLAAEEEEEENQRLLCCDCDGCDADDADAEEEALASRPPPPALLVASSSAAHVTVSTCARSSGAGRARRRGARQRGPLAAGAPCGGLNAR